MQHKIKPPISAATEHEGNLKYFKQDYKPQQQDCKQYLNCNAPICPFDKQWRNRTHLKGEPVCFYLKEYSKPHVRAILEGLMSQKQYQVIVEAHPEVVFKHEPIKAALKRASRNSSRLVKQLKKQVA